MVEFSGIHNSSHNLSWDWRLELTQVEEVQCTVVLDTHLYSTFLRRRYFDFPANLMSSVISAMGKLHVLCHYYENL